MEDQSQIALKCIDFKKRKTSLNGSLGGNITFTTSISTPVATLKTIIWTFHTNNIVTYTDGTTFPATGYKDRIFLNTTTGSLLLRNLGQNDQGTYRVNIIKDYETLIEIAQLNVFGDSVILSCSSSGSSPFSYHWLNGRILTITNVTRYDKGPYKCFVSNPVSNNISSEPLNLIISCESLTCISIFF
uniref:Ig-like domain-containing protein n=1 Tax=Esox lucius TaxID=8010 RepID=A0AAY5KDL8_ESOLU